MNNHAVVPIDSNSFFIKTQTANDPKRLADIERIYRIMVGNGADDSALRVFSGPMDHDLTKFWGDFDQARICGEQSVITFVLSIVGIYSPPTTVLAEGSPVTAAIRRVQKGKSFLGRFWSRNESEVVA